MLRIFDSRCGRAQVYIEKMQRFSFHLQLCVLGDGFLTVIEEEAILFDGMLGKDSHAIGTFPRIHTTIGITLEDRGRHSLLPSRRVFLK